MARGIDNVNEGWNESIPFAGPRPQSDYSVGFKPLAFTEDQRKRLKPFIGDPTGRFIKKPNIDDRESVVGIYTSPCPDGLR